MFCCAKRYRTAGASLLELLIAVSVLGLLAALLLTRLVQLEAAAERAYVDYTVSALKSALRLRVARMMLEGRLQEAEKLAGGNPMDLLDGKPSNYVQAMVSGASASRSGSWYFDAATGELLYVFKSGPMPWESGSRAVAVRVERSDNRAEASAGQVHLVIVTRATDTVRP